MIRSLILIGIAALSIVFLVAFALNLSPYLRGPDEWRWAYAIPGKPTRHLIPALTLAAYIAVIALWGGRLAGTERPSRRAVWGFLMLLWLAVPAIQASLLSTEGPDVFKPLFFRTASVLGSGVFAVGSTVNGTADFLRHWMAV